MTATQGLSNVSSLYAALQSSPLSALANASTQGAASVSANGGQNLAAISGPGQLVSNLQQLQAQDPAKFQQMVTTIAGQLQAAAQQQGATPAGQALSALASRFQNVAQNGDLSQLQVHHHGHHHGHHGYNRVGQSTDSTDTSTQNLSPDVQQLFATLNREVSQALKS